MRTWGEGIVFAVAMLVIWGGFLLLPKPKLPVPHVNFPDAPAESLKVAQGHTESKVSWDYRGIGRVEMFRVSGKVRRGFYLVFDEDTSESVSPWELLEMKREVARLRADVDRLTILTSATVRGSALTRLEYDGQLIYDRASQPATTSTITSPDRVDPRIFLEGLK